MIELLFGESEAASMQVAKCKQISIVTDGSTAVFCFLSVITDNKGYRRKNVIGNLSLNKHYNCIFRLNGCL